MKRTPSWNWLALMALLALGVGGCGSPTGTPEFPVSPSATRAVTLLPTSPNEDLPEAFVRILVGDGSFSSYRELFIIYSQVVDEKDLWFGVSRKKNEMRQCWFYQDRSLSLCTEAGIDRAFYPQEGAAPVPRIFFAIATFDEKEALVILDFVHNRSALDPVDGFRVVLQVRRGTWQVKSWAQVY